MRGLRQSGRSLVWIFLALFLGPTMVFSQNATEAQYYAAGNQMYSAKSYARAAQYYYAAVKLNPNNALAYQGLGNCYYALGRKADALSFYQRASALQPANAQLAQFVQNLRAQVAGGAAAASPAAPANSQYLTSGMTLLQRRDYATAIRYFNAAIQQNPSDYRGYYYAGYAYYLMGNARNAALYFAIANAKQPNASIKAYADRVKATLPPESQQWVDDQAAKYMGTAVAGTPSSKKKDVSFGFHLMGGMEYILADPTQITDAVSNAYAGTGFAHAVSLSGIAPSMVALPELEPFVQLGQSFEINLALGYFPVGNLSYKTFDYSQPNTFGGVGGGNFSAPDVWQYTFNTTIITADLGVKILFGDKSVQGYLGLGGGLSPVSLAFTKLPYDQTGTSATGLSSLASGNYSSVAFNGQAILGADFYLSPEIALGPYVGYRYLSATSFQMSGATLSIDTKNGAVGIPGLDNMPVTDPNKPLTLDFSGIEGGVNLTFSF